jgi:hypothetical protein
METLFRWWQKLELSFNDKVLDYEVVLDDGFKEFELKLENGVNQFIVFELTTCASSWISSILIRSSNCKW